MSTRDTPKGKYERVLFTFFTFGAVILLLSIFFIVYDVIARNVGLSPFKHTIALTEYGLYYMTLLGAPWLVRKKQHIYIQLLTGLVPDSIRPTLGRFCYFLCTVTCTVICYYAGLITVENFIRGDYEVRSFDMPRWMIYMVMSISFFLLSIEFSRYLLGFDSMYSGEMGIKE